MSCPAAFLCINAEGNQEQCGPDFYPFSPNGDLYFHDAIWDLACKKQEQLLDYRDFEIELSESDLIRLLNKLTGIPSESKLRAFLGKLFTHFQYSYPDNLRHASVSMVAALLKHATDGYRVVYQCFG